MSELREGIIKALTVLEWYDRDLRSIAIWLNPNNEYHAKMLGGYPNKEVLAELNIMLNDGIITLVQKKIGKLIYKLYTLTEEV